VSFLVIIWSIGFIHKKYGVMIFLFLSGIQFLVGGSFVLDLALKGKQGDGSLFDNTLSAF